MSSDKSRKPSWRSDVPKKERKQEARPAWQCDAEGPVEVTPRWNRKTKIGVGVLCFLAFNALLIFVILWLIPPKPSCVVLLGVGYEDNLAVPHNAYGTNGLEVRWLRWLAAVPAVCSAWAPVYSTSSTIRANSRAATNGTAGSTISRKKPF